MKKLLAILLAVSISFILSACGNKNSNEAVNTPTISEIEEKTEEQNQPTEATKPTAKPSIDTGYESGPFNKSATIEETIIYDENDIKITATELIYDNYSVNLSLLIENHSEENLVFRSNTLGYSCNSINGLMVEDGYFSCEVNSGKKAYDTMSFEYEPLLLSGINVVSDIEVGIYYQDDDYNDVKIPPIQIKTSEFESYDYSSNTYADSIGSKTNQKEYQYTVKYLSSDVISNDSGININSQIVSINKDDDYTLLLEIENTTNEIILFTIKDLAVNGITINDSNFDTITINPHKRAIASVNLISAFEKEYIDIFEITEIGKIDISIYVKDPDGKFIMEEKDFSIIIPDADSTCNLTGTELYNNNGISVTYKTNFVDTEKYSSYGFKFILIIKNESNSTIRPSLDYNSLSINGFMVDYYTYGKETNAGETTFMVVSVYKDSIDENMITSFTDAEFTFEIDSDERSVEDSKIINITF